MVSQVSENACKLADNYLSCPRCCLTFRQQLQRVTLVVTTTLRLRTAMTFHNLLDVAPHLLILVVPAPAVPGRPPSQKKPADVVFGGRTALTAMTKDPLSLLPRNQILLQIDYKVFTALLNTGSCISALSLRLCGRLRKMVLPPHVLIFMSALHTFVHLSLLKLLAFSTMECVILLRYPICVLIDGLLISLRRVLLSPQKDGWRKRVLSRDFALRT